MIGENYSSINKNGIASIISAKTKITKTDALYMVNNVVDAMIEALSMNEVDQVRVGGLGSFKKIKIKERFVISPKDKTKIKIPQYKQISFRAGKALKETVKKQA